MTQLLSSRHFHLLHKSVYRNNDKGHIKTTIDNHIRSLVTVNENTASTSTVKSNEKGSSTTNNNNNNNNNTSTKNISRENQYKIHPKLKTYNAISKTLYKQILKWTHITGTHVPFDTTIPPLTLQPPLIDKRALETLAASIAAAAAKGKNEGEDKEDSNDLGMDSHDYLMNLLPSNCIVDEYKLVIPIQDTLSIRNTTKLAFALNHYGHVTQHQHQHQQHHKNEKKDNEMEQYINDIKERTTLGFEVLKSLNELSEILNKRKEERINHYDRDGVLFHIGQVVQHKTMRWRAVVSGWNKTKTNDDGIRSDDDDDDDNDDDNEKKNSTSLTTKKYEPPKGLKIEPNTDVEYTLLLDEGDAVLSRTRVLGSKKVKQHELEPVNDPYLKRVRCSIAGNYFNHFDLQRNTFHPDHILAYEYPKDVTVNIDAVADADEDDVNVDVDVIEEFEKEQKEIDLKRNAEHVTNEIRAFASELKTTIIDPLLNSQNDDKPLVLIAQLEKDLDSMLNIHLQDEENIDTLKTSTTRQQPTSQKNAIQHLNAILSIFQKVTQVMWHRRTSSFNKERIQFSLGSIVRHKKYNFRGIIAGWDAYPRTDVSRWDGLQDIKGEVNDMPFYHVIADMNDTEEAFGYERRFRYVCQENLELCDVAESATAVPSLSSERNLELDLDDGWRIVKHGTDGVEYLPSDELKFQHGEHLETKDEEVMVEKCMNDIISKMNGLLVEMRVGKKNNGEQQQRNLQLDNIFKILENADSLEDAYVVEEFIKEIWKVHEVNEVRWALEDGTEALLRGDRSKASHIFEDIIINLDPNYLEAYNKKATCHYMLGEMKKSIEAAERVCEMEPRHFQAYAGLGLVYNDLTQYKEATKYFRRSLRLQPWSPVASRLSVCLDLMKRLELQEEVEY